MSKDKAWNKFLEDKEIGKDKLAKQTEELVSEIVKEVEKIFKAGYEAGKKDKE